MLATSVDHELGRAAERAADTRLLAETRLLERGLDPARATDLLNMIELATAHVIALPRGCPDRDRFRRILSESLDALEADAYGRPPRPGPVRTAILHAMRRHKSASPGWNR